MLNIKSHKAKKKKGKKGKKSQFEFKAFILSTEINKKKYFLSQSGGKDEH